MEKNLSTDTFDRVTQIISNVLALDNMEWTRETTAKEVDGWTSISHIKIMIAVEKEFSIRFDTTEATRPDNVGELSDLVVSKS